MTVHDVVRSSLSDVWITFTYVDASVAPKPDMVLSIDPDSDVSNEMVLSDALLSSEVHTIAARDGVVFVSVLEEDLLSLAERGVRG